MAGKTVSCPKCKHPIAIPAAGTPTPEAGPAPEGAEQPPMGSAPMAPYPGAMPDASQPNAHGGFDPYGLGYPQSAAPPYGGGNWGGGFPTGYGAPPGSDPAQYYGPAGYAAPHGYGPAPGYGPPQGPMMGQPYGTPGQAMPDSQRSPLIWWVAGGAGVVVVILMLLMLTGGEPEYQPVAANQNNDIVNGPTPPIPERTANSNTTPSRSSSSNATTQQPASRPTSTQTTPQTTTPASTPPVRPTPSPATRPQPRWKATLDAGKPFEYPDSVRAFPAERWMRINYSLQHGPFVCVSSKDRGERFRKIVNLRTGDARSFTYANQELNAKLEACIAVNAEGTLVAAAFEGLRGPDGKRRCAIGVISLADGEVLAEAFVARAPKRIEFVTSTQAIALGDGLNNVYSSLDAYVLDANSTEELKNYSLGERLDAANVAISPGGKYVAVPSEEQVNLFELASGRQIGTAPIPKPSQSSNKGNPRGLAFSPDGRELVGAFAYQDDLQFVRWNASTGMPLASTLHYRPQLQKLLDSSEYMVASPAGDCYLLRGRVLIDRATGAPFYALEGDDELRSPRLLRRDALLGITLTTENGGKRGDQFAMVKLSNETLDSALKTILAENSINAAPMGATGTATYEEAQTLQMPSQVAWQAPPAMGVDNAKLAHEPFEIAPAQHAVTGVAFSRAQPRLVAVSVSRQGGNAHYLQRFDILAKNSHSKLALPDELQVAALSPEGSRAIVWKGVPRMGGRGWHEQLDLYSFSEKRHLIRWTPYQDTSSSQRSGSVDRESRARVVWLEFTDEDHLLTINGTGTLVMWKLPEAKPLWRIFDFGMQAALNSNRRAVVGSSGYVVSVPDGKCLGQLDPSPLGGEPSSLAFSTDGRRLFANCFNKEYEEHSVVEWDWATGKIVKAFWIPIVGRSLSPQTSLVPLGRSYLLLPGSRLVDLERQMIVWQYEHPHALPTGPTIGTRITGIPADGYTFIDQNSTAPGLLVRVELPHASALQAAARANRDAQILAPPGAAMRLGSIGFNAGGKSPQQVITEAFAKSGYIIDPQATVTISVSQQEKATGNVSTYQRIDGRGGTYKVQDRQITSTVTVTDSLGRRWTATQLNTNHGMMVPDGADVTATFNEGMRKGATQFMNHVRIPRCLFVEPKDLGIGRSILEGNRIVDQPANHTP